MNVLITGTPGTGKTTLSLKIADRTKMTHVNVSDLVKSERLYETFDRKFESYLIDEKRLLRKLRPLIRKGNIIVDTHQCSMFPAKWFDLVVVLTVDNTNLYDRLKARNYSDLKIQENIDCEIMCVISEEAIETFGEDRTIILSNATRDDINSNIEKIITRFDEMDAGIEQ